MFAELAPKGRFFPTPRQLRPRPTLVIAVTLLAYGLCFAGLHHLAATWGAGYFSLWFPAAGLRFAYLWRAGPRMTPAAALAELLGQLSVGETTLTPAPLLAVVGTLSPCLVYGFVIYLVRQNLDHRQPTLGLAPLPFVIAALIGPVVACVTALPWALPLASNLDGFSGQVLLKTLLVFTLGDMLGVLTVAPPLLWLAAQIQGRAWPKLTVSIPLAAEVSLALLASWGLVALVYASGLGLILAPVLLATCWIGLRVGRLGAWISIALAAVIVLPMTSVGPTESERLTLHMLLACIGAVGFLAGSYSEAMSRAQAGIARRDRMLFQAERLKTLRAMSVAVIHEISQPLSTISIEANNLAQVSTGSNPNVAEIVEVSQLIARKADDLSKLVRRLRRFGNRGGGTVSSVPLTAIYHDLAAIAAADAQLAQVELEFREIPEAWVKGDDIELRQALLNLIRNAIAFAPSHSTILVHHRVRGSRVRIFVENQRSPGQAGGTGMGIGLIISRAIAAAHGGSVGEERADPNRTIYTLELPAAGDIDD